MLTRIWSPADRPRRFVDPFTYFALAVGIGLLLHTAPSVADAGPAKLTAVVNVHGAAKELKSWTLQELEELKPANRREKDPKTGNVVRWQGVSLSELVDQALKNVSASERATIDLVVIQGDKGAQALIPRWFVQRYPMIVALSREGRSLGDQGPFFTVVPWTSVSKISKEAVPLESFFVPGVKRIEFSNYRDHFGRYFLKRRSDPAAIRGEKVFVQNCATCHAAGIPGAHAPQPEALLSLERIQKLVTSGHPSVLGAAKPKLDERELKGLMSYVHAIRSEPVSSGVPAQSAANN